jgi:hypothetical protein
VLLSHRSRLCYHGVSRIFDCPYTSNYRRETGRKRGKCPDSCLGICCERQSERESFSSSLLGECDLPSPPPSSSSSQTMDDFLWKNECSGEMVHSNLEGIHCPKRRRRFDDQTTDPPPLPPPAPISSSTFETCCFSCRKNLLSEEEEKRVLNYLKFSRININVRQVYPSTSTATDASLH